MSTQTLEDQIQDRAKDIGFDVCRITEASLQALTGDRLAESIEAGHHASMQWLADTYERRKTPEAMWSDAKSAILLGMNYGPNSDPMKTLSLPDKATISVYARNRDYHDIIKGKLKTLASWLASKTSEEVKVFVDTAPLMEKPLAQKAGIGWQGKHTNLVSRNYGSWLFLGSILTTADLTPHKTEIDHCGSCSSCLDICPTSAFPAPYQLDARRCISYLTIEHDGPIPTEFREPMGNRIYGCDDCLAVCPWNKYASQTNEMKLSARDDLTAPDLIDLVQLDDQSFREMFSGSPIKRIKRDRFIRNVLIAIGNSGLQLLKPQVIKLLDDKDATVRATAVWTLSKLEKRSQFTNMKKKYVVNERDPIVLNEWNAAYE